LAAVSTSSSRSSSSTFRPSFYGVNYDVNGASAFAHSDAAGLLSRLAPSTLRWPGGNEADYFNWRTGTSTKEPYRSPLLLSDLEAAYRATHAIPVFDLNVLAGKNATNPADQIEMLKSAQHLGLPIKYVEIGNELYGGGIRAKVFPTGTSYGTTVAIYVRALHAAFPGVEVGADGVLFPTDPRMQSWNAEMLAAATGSGSPDAVIFHDYPGAYENPFTSEDVPTLFATIEPSASYLSQAIDRLGGKPVWLTEYNFRGPYQELSRDVRNHGANPVQTSFAHELYLAAFALLLPRVDHLALADNWAAFNGAAFSAWTDPAHPALTPGGQAVEVVDTAAHGTRSVTAITGLGAPALPGGSAGVVGDAFTGTGGVENAVMVNLSDRSWAAPVGTDLPAGAHYLQVDGDPTAALKYAPTPVSGTVGTGHLELPPYSLTVVGPAADDLSGNGSVQ
jgi:hypothetical protein